MTTMRRSIMRSSTRVLIVSVAVLGLLYVSTRADHHRVPHLSLGPFPPDCVVEAHPIDALVSKSSSTWSKLIEKQTTTYENSVAAYLARRGRPPPPGFDRWFSYAHSRDAVIVEDFFDQIYTDVEPFWGIEPARLRASIAAWPDNVEVRGGRVIQVPNQFMRTNTWVEMLSKIVQHLPDMDIPLNRLDEARVIATRNTLDAALKAAASQKAAMGKAPTNAMHSSLASMALQENAKVVPSPVAWSFDKYQLQQAVRGTCPRRSPLALSKASFGTAGLRNADSGSKYVEVVQAAKDLCQYPEMMSQHGALIEPATVDFTTTLIPVFSASKLPVYNDIVIPEPAYYSDEIMFTGKTWLGDWSQYYTWKNKIHGLVWRGSATGGATSDDNWQFSHRHRLIARLNASEERIEIAGERPSSPGFAAWLASSADAAFTRFFCNDREDAKTCPSLASHFRLAKPIKMASQYQWKYLPDTDGNSASERFRAFLLSNSVPIKASIFYDWHDARLQAWHHYVPMKLSYNDLYDIMAYFLGYEKTCAHDAIGEQIAQDGRRWAEKVLRKDDMVIYLHRALLEFARVTHDKRDRLGQTVGE